MNNRTIINWKICPKKKGRFIFSKYNSKLRLMKINVMLILTTKMFLDSKFGNLMCKALQHPMVQQVVLCSVTFNTMKVTKTDLVNHHRAIPMISHLESTSFYSPKIHIHLCLLQMQHHLETSSQNLASCQQHDRQGTLFS